MPELTPLEKTLLPRGHISKACLSEICAGGSIIEEMGSGPPKVVRCSGPNGEALILKLWYEPRHLSSARLVPYSTRFRKNARGLRARGVSAPRVLGWGSVQGQSARYVCYEELPGRSLREWVPHADLAAAGRFIADLHKIGIDFRSLHMGNILRDEEGLFSLVDVTDCRFYRKPLTLTLRTRRVLYFCIHRKEREYLKSADRWMEFLEAYCEASSTQPAEMIRLAKSPLLRLRLPVGVRQAADALLSGQ